MVDESHFQRYRKLIAQLRQQRATWDPVWKDLIAYLMPRRGRLMGDQAAQANKGYQETTKILDATGTKGLLVGASGLSSGMTSPAQQWFGYATQDDDLNEWPVAKQWLEDSATRIANLFRASNLYNVLPSIYMDLLGLGTNATGMVEDDEDVFRFHPFPIGSYYLATDDRGVVDTCVRDVAMTVRQVVGRYGYDNCSAPTQRAFDNGNTEEPVNVCQVITPNHEHDPKRIGGRFKAWRSCHFEAAATDDKFLLESGFDELPILASRWAVEGENVYGEAPAFNVLPDVKELQLLKRRKAQAVDKSVNPPWMAPADMASGELDTRPGAVNYYSRNSNAGQQQTTPLYAGALNIGEVRQDIADVQRAINSGLYVDLFLMLTMDQRAQPATAAEIYAKQEEKLLMLGPALGQMSDELLDPLVGRAFAIASRRGLLRPAPPELQGMALGVRYESVLAKAQKLAGVAAQERLVGHVGQLSLVHPEAMDAIDWDKEVSSYADRVGAPASLLRTPEAIAAIRQQRQQAQAQQAAIANAQGVARGAKDLASAKLGEDTLLSQLAGRMTGGGN